jgi:hypothetical protein
MTILRKLSRNNFSKQKKKKRNKRKEKNKAKEKKETKQHLKRSSTSRSD